MASHLPKSRIVVIKKLYGDVGSRQKDVGLWVVRGANEDFSLLEAESEQLRVPVRDWQGGVREGVQGQGEKNWAIVRDEGDVQGSVSMWLCRVLAKKSNESIRN